MAADNMGDGFSWDNAGVPEDFFNDSPEDLAAKTEATAVIEEIQNDDNENSGQNTEKTDEELADELFNDETQNNDIDDEDVEEEEIQESQSKDTEKSKSTAVKSTMVSTANILKEKGIIDFELEEGEELTEEDADNLIEDGFDTAVDNRLKDLFEGMPDVVKQLVKFTKDGGDPVQFISTIVKNQSSGLSVGMDLKNEANQELVMKSVLKEQGYDDDYIDIHIETLKDSNKLAGIAEKQYKAWETKNTKANEDLVRTQAEKREQDKLKLRQEKAKLSTTLGTLTDIGGIKLNNKDKKELPSYLHDKTIELKNGTSISTYQKDVWEVLGNETASLQLAKLLRTRKADGTFDFSKLEMNAQTKIVKKIKDEVQRNKNIHTPQRSVNNGSRKELADFF